MVYQIFGIGLPLILLIVAIVFFVWGFIVKKFLKWMFILAILALLAAGAFWFF